MQLYQNKHRQNKKSITNKQKNTYTETHTTHIHINTQRKTQRHTNPQKHKPQLSTHINLQTKKEQTI